MKPRLLKVATATAAILCVIFTFFAVFTAINPFQTTLTTTSQTTYFVISRYGNIRLVRQAVTPLRSGNFTPNTAVLDVHGAFNGGKHLGHFSFRVPAMLGFQFAHHRWGWFMPPGSIGASGLASSRDIFTFDYSSVGCPYWFPTLLMLSFVVVQMRFRLTQDRRHRTGCCLNCGYDLRATSDRCPECGTSAPNPSQ